MKEKRPTTSSIAALAGVSQSTVSMILNNPNNPRFSQQTVKKVLKAAEEVKYQPRPRTVKSPVSFPTKCLLIVCPVLSNPYYASLVQAAEQEAAKSNFFTIVCDTYRSARREQEILAAFSGGSVAGIIFTFIPQSRELVEKLSQKIPVVVIGDRNTAINVDTVEIDSILSGTLAARHLRELGHCHAAFLSTTLDEKNAVRVNRLNGFTQTFERDGDGDVQVFSETVTAEEDLHDPMIEYAVGFRLAQQAMRDNKTTALVAVNDMVAYGAFSAVQQAGLSVPGDYSICGFDNIFPSQFPALSLTTVEHYIMEKGRNAVRILSERLCSDQDSPLGIKRLEYRPRLIIRQSTGKPRL